MTAQHKYNMPIFTKKFLRLFRFLLVGACGAGLYIVGSFILSKNGMKAWIASFIIYTCLIPIVYFIQSKFVFESSITYAKSFPRYLAIQMIGLGLSALMPFLLAKFNVNPIISFFSVALVISLISYVLQLFWVFSANSLKGGFN